MTTLTYIVGSTIQYTFALTTVTGAAVPLTRDHKPTWKGTINNVPYSVDLKDFIDLNGKLRFPLSQIVRKEKELPNIIGRFFITIGDSERPTGPITIKVIK